MKIAIISDIHENFHNLTLFLQEVKKYDVGKIIFLGDFINNGIAKILASSPIPVYAIWGNNDGDKVAITKTSLAKGSNMEVGFDTFDILEIENKKIFITHYPMLAKPMAKSGDFAAVFYGHDHHFNLETINNCLVLNPGEISAHKTSKATFAIYDLDANQAEIITLDGSISLKTEESVNYRKENSIEFSKSRTHQY